MAIEAALYTRLTTHSGTAALVATRVYPNVLPQAGTRPAVTYRRISGTREHAMGSDPGNVLSRFQVDCWADSYTGMIALWTQVFSALSRYRATVGSEVIDDIYAGAPMDLYEDEKNLHRRMTDFMIWHRES